MKKVYSVLKKLSEYLGKLCAFLLFIWVFIITADIIMRYIFNSPIKGTVELTELWLSIIVFASFPLVQTQKAHVGVIMAVKALPERVSMVVYSVSNLICSITCGLVTYAAVQQAIRCFNRNMITDVLRIPKYPFYIFESVCMALFCLLLLAETVYCIYGIFNRDAAKEIRSHWV